MTMNLPVEIQEVCTALLMGLNALLGEKLFGVYLYGALAFPEGGATGDIDFHVLLYAALDDTEKEALQSLHHRLAQDYPPLGAELDGYYLLLEEARQRRPPRHQLLEGVVDNSWALHRAHLWAGRCIVLHGPDPKTVYPQVTWPELESALEGELDYVARHLGDYPAYCVLNLCRLMYSYQTREVVVSKLASAQWAMEAYPVWRHHIEAAKRSYAGSATIEETQLLVAEVRDFYAFATEQIQDCRRNRESG
jgi:hypothetical protein